MLIAVEVATSRRRFRRWRPVRRRRAKADDDLGQFLLAVAVDAGDTEDLAGGDGERDILKRFGRTRCRESRTTGCRSDSGGSLRADKNVCPTGVGKGLVEREAVCTVSGSTFSPTIRSARFFGRRIADRAAPDDFAAAEDGDLVADALDLAELVADEDHAAAAARRRSMAEKSWSVSAGVSTAVGSSRIRMRRRAKGFENLDALLLADRSESTRATGSIGRPRPSARSASFRAAATSVEEFSGTAVAEQDVVEDGHWPASMKCWWTMPTPAAIASRGDRKRRGGRRCGSRRRRGGSCRRRRSSAWICPRRSRPGRRGRARGRSGR